MSASLEFRLFKKIKRGGRLNFSRKKSNHAEKGEYFNANHLNTWHLGGAEKSAELEEEFSYLSGYII